MTLKTKIFLLGVILGGVFLCAPSAMAETNLPSNITSDLTLTTDHSPYLISATPAKIAAGVTVTIEPGVVIKFYSNARWDVYGSLVVNGTSDAHVTFTTNKAVPAKGSWGQIKFWDSSTAAFSYADILYGGFSNAYLPVTEVINKSGVSFDHVTFINNASNAFSQRSDTISNLNDVSFVNNGTQKDNSALIVRQGAVNLTGFESKENKASLECGQVGESYASFRPVLNLKNGSFMDRAEINAAVITLNNTCNINPVDVIWPTGDQYVYFNGTVSGDMVMPDFGLPIRTSLRTSLNKITGSLTIPAGQIWKFPQYSGLTVSGQLTVNGEGSRPVTFTSLKDDSAGGDTNSDATSSVPQAGDWDGLHFYSSQKSPPSILNFVELNYGGLGYEGGILYNGEVYADLNSDINFTHLVLGPSFKDHCLFVAREGSVFIDQSDLSGCNVAAVENTNASKYVEAKENYWGDTSGPYHAVLNPEGKGVEAMGKVNFEPWLDEAPKKVLLPTGWTDVAWTSPSGPVEIKPALRVGLEINPTFIHRGEKAVLNWTSDGADVLKLYPGGDTLTGSSGFMEIAPTETTTYKLEGIHDVVSTTTEALITVSPLDRDPVIIIPGILGSWPKNKGTGGELMLDPIMRTYDDLLNTLRLNGYEDDKTLFTFPYEWRNSNEITAKLLANKIAEVRARCDCPKVDLVAHSMGGLVARVYIQSDEYKDDVDQVIFLGTPHKGAPKAYIAWESGKMEGDRTSVLLNKIFSDEAKNYHYKSTAEYVRSKVKSVGELLPIFSYLKKDFTASLLTYFPCNSVAYPCNTFLEGLNTNIAKLLKRVRVVNISDSDPEGTLMEITVEPDNDWLHGKPTDKFYSLGDGTVPTASSVLSGVNQAVYHGIGHSSMPTALRKEVSQTLLAINNVAVSKPLNLIQKVLFIDKHSPVNLGIVDSEGNEFGFKGSDSEDVYYSGPRAEGEYLAILNPIDGEYKIKAYGNGEGSYEIDVTLVTDQSSEMQALYGVANKQSEDFLSINIDGNKVYIPESDKPLPAITSIEASVLTSYNAISFKDVKTNQQLSELTSTPAVLGEQTRATAINLDARLTIIRKVFSERNIIILMFAFGFILLMYGIKKL